METFYVIFPIIGNFLCDFSNHWKKAIALFLGLAAFAGAQEFTLQTDYENFVFDPSPEGGAYSNYFGVWPKPGQTNGSTLLYDGHVLGNTNGTAPAGGGFMLPYSSFGQTIEGIQADFALGDEITPPPGANISVPPANFVARTAGNNTNAYYECTDPLGGAFWAPSTYKVFAAQPNNVEIHWRMLDGSTNVQVVTIDAVPCKRPARLFWTESPYDAPKVNLDGLFPKLHYNSEVSAPVYVVTTNQYGGMTDVVSNVVSGVWIDDQKQLHAVGVSGMFLLEYYKEGSYSAQVEPHAIEVVQVLEPEIATLEADIGERLLPVDSYWSQVDGDAGVYPQVQRGINDTVYVNALDGPKDNWAYAIKKTVDEPWAIEIYWEHEGLMNVMWPYEVDWYSCDWPTHPQRYVMAENTQYQARVLIPGGLTAQVMPFMEPNLHANLTTSGR
ncbi:MAG: hypothetical protein EOM20_19160, partial [Spartobacteria bacterium]|nr:hypothetical protein [Spartobacteria bacterium]